MHLKSIWSWYAQGAEAHLFNLSLLSLAPGRLLYAGMILSSTLSLLLSVTIIRRIVRMQATVHH